MKSLVVAGPSRARADRAIRDSRRRICSSTTIVTAVCTTRLNPSHYHRLDRAKIIADDGVALAGTAA